MTIAGRSSEGTMLESLLIDGKRSLELELVEWSTSVDMVRMVRLSGGRIPSLSDIDTQALPSFAFVNQGRWITSCPQPRCPGTSFVWINGPYQFLCNVCANLGIRCRWRPVIVPNDWRDIERVLFERYVPVERNWTPGETLDDLLAQNLVLGYPIPPEMADRAESALRAYQDAQAEEQTQAFPPVPIPYPPASDDE
jgi:hypothetical protein